MNSYKTNLCEISNCIACTSDLSLCSLCANNFFSSDGSCVPCKFNVDTICTCGGSTFQSCASCLGDGCGTCVGGVSAVNGVCEPVQNCLVEGCQVGEFCAIGVGQCQKCVVGQAYQCECGNIMNCTSCIDQVKCDECIVGYEGERCDMCDAGYYKENELCVKCGKGCESCGNDGKCRVCASGYQMTVNQSCQEDCVGEVVFGEFCLNGVYSVCGETGQITQCNCGESINCLNCLKGGQKIIQGKCQDCLPGYKFGEDKNCNQCKNGYEQIGTYCFQIDNKQQVTIAEPIKQHQGSRK